MPKKRSPRKPRPRKSGSFVWKEIIVCLSPGMMRLLRRRRTLLAMIGYGRTINDELSEHLLDAIAREDPFVELALKEEIGSDEISRRED